MEMSGEPSKFTETRFCGMDPVAGSRASVSKDWRHSSMPPRQSEEFPSRLGVPLRERDSLGFTSGGKEFPDKPVTV